MEAKKITKVKQLAESLPVPRVQEFVKYQKPTAVPLRYVRSDQDPPFIFDSIISSSQIPIIDLQKLLLSSNHHHHHHHHHHHDFNGSDQELHKLHHACKHWGFFQLINHGVGDSVVENMKSGVEQLFNLPNEEKNKLSQKPGDIEGFGQAFVVSDEQKLDWGDLFGVTTFPLHLRNPRLFDNLPLPLRDDIDVYASEMKNVAMKLVDCMGKALKMEEEEIKELFEEGWQAIRVNYYPPCPEPELVMGINSHSDISALTILLQVNEMEGLQIKKDGEWIPVNPLPNAFVVNVGDSMEIISNGIYRSIEHRATVNSVKERISVATFFTPRLDGEMGPAQTLLNTSSSSSNQTGRALFKRIGVADYIKGYFGRELNGKSYLDVARIKNGSN